MKINEIKPKSCVQCNVLPDKQTKNRYTPPQILTLDVAREVKGGSSSNLNESSNGLMS